MNVYIIILFSIVLLWQNNILFLDSVTSVSVTLHFIFTLQCKMKNELKEKLKLIIWKALRF